MIGYVVCLATLAECLIPLTNCYRNEARLSLNVHIHKLCATIVPTQDPNCMLLPTIVNITANISVYNKTLFQTMTNFIYTSTTRICVSCPLIGNISDPACVNAIPATSSAIFSITTMTHQAFIYVYEMDISALGVSGCYNSDTSILFIRMGTSEVCAALTPTGECDVIPASAAVTQALMVYNGRGWEALPCNTPYSNASTMLCCSTALPPGAVNPLADSLNYPWINGTYTIGFSLRTIPYTATVNLPTFTTSYCYGCIVGVNLTVAPSLVVAVFETNATMALDQCSTPAESYGYIQAAVYITVPSTGNSLTVSFVVEYFNLSQDGMLIFKCGVNEPKAPTSSMQVCGETSTAIKQSADAVYGVLALNYRDFNGSIMNTVRVRAGRIVLRVWQKVFVNVLETGLALVSETPQNQTNVDNQLPNAELLYLMTITVKGWKVSDKGLEMPEIIKITQNATWSPSIQTVEFSCTNVVNMSYDSCVSILPEIYRGRALHIASINWISYELTTDLKKTNYTDTVVRFRNGAYKHTISVLVGIGFGLSLPILITILAYMFIILRKSIQFTAFLRGRIEQMSSEASSI